jgi:peptide/nickel transport system substrate-binding protein
LRLSGTVIARRTQKSPPGQGGWHLYINSMYGVDCVDPMNKLIRASGELEQNGWANVPEVEAEVAAWYEAKSLAAEKEAVRRLNKAALDKVVYAPLGSYLKNVSGIAQGPLPFFWGVSKTA